MYAYRAHADQFISCVKWFVLTFHEQWTHEVIFVYFHFNALDAAILLIQV